NTHSTRKFFNQALIYLCYFKPEFRIGAPTHSLVFIGREPMVELISFFKKLEPQMIEWLCSFVNSDTPSDHKRAIDQFVRRLASQFGECGADIQIIQNTDTGDHLLARFQPWRQTGKPILILGHTDTVWDIDESERRPAQIID